MRLQPYVKTRNKAHQGYAIIWRAIDDASGFFNYRVTFNNKDEALASESKSYGSMQTVKEVAQNWLRLQPLKAQPRGFQFINANPRSVDGESNDCAVRALSLAFNKPYSEVHALCAKIGRVEGRGMRSSQIELAIQELSNNGIAKLAKPYRAQTFTTFARDNKRGNYLIIKRGHAVAMIDGVFHDAGSIGEPRAIVKSFYKVGA